VANIATALRGVSASSRKELIAAVEGAASQELSNTEAATVVRSLQSLYLFKASAESPLPEFVSGLIAAMQASENEGLAAADDNKAVLTTKLTDLLSLSSLERFYKTEQLKADHQQIFYDAKIVTDLRPVFDQPKEPPVGAIVTHTLKIIFHEYGEHRELYFSLDAEDVVTLKKIAERAIDKMSSLQALLASASITDLS
jgi:hypothetical protein